MTVAHLRLCALSLTCRCSHHTSTVKQEPCELAWYVHKYYSKSSQTPSHAMIRAGMLVPCGSTPSTMWHTQAQVLSRVLPIDVVRIIGAFVREQAAVLVQKWVRGAAICVDHWGQVSCLCDMDGNLVYL